MASASLARRMTRPPALAAAALAIAALAAGCVAPGGREDEADAAFRPSALLPADWAELGVPWGDEHDHADATQHAGLTTPNFRVLGYDPLVTEATGTTLTGMGCGGVANATDGRRLAVVHSISTDVAFVVADVTDPDAPAMLGEYYLPNVVVWDATITADGKHALVGAYPWAFGGPTNLVLPGSGGSHASDVPPTAFRVQPMWRDACTGEVRAAGLDQYVPYGPAILLVSLADPSNPRLEDWVPQPAVGPHSVTSAMIDGTVYATSSVTNLVHEASYYSFFEVVETPAGGKLSPLSVIEAPGVESPRLNGHVDVEIAKHPVTGTVLAYLANWDGGVAVYDFSNPRAPAPLATWKDGNAGSIHETLPLATTWDGRHYTIAGQEVGEPADLPSGWVYVLDTTDPAKPEEVSRWTLPVKPDWDGGLQFSTHYVGVVGRTLFVTNYHGGMWAVDLTDVQSPHTVGLFVPDRASPKPHASCPCGPSVEDVVPDEDGTLTVWDGAGGIYELRFDATDPAPPLREWPTRAT